MAELGKKRVVAAVLLAAGSSSRMGAGGFHKLLAEFDGIPLVRRSALTALTSQVASVTVVTGYRHPEIMEALQGLDIHNVHNQNHRSGIAGSLVDAFITDPIQTADGVLVLNADMPMIKPLHLDSLIAAFHDACGDAVVRATGTFFFGNPVILPKYLYPGVLQLQGDVGARELIKQSGVPVVDVFVEDEALLDVDTVEAVLAAGGTLRS